MFVYIRILVNVHVQYLIDQPKPAGTLRYIYVVFMLRGHVKITFEFMFECLLLFT